MRTLLRKFLLSIIIDYWAGVKAQHVFTQGSLENNVWRSAFTSFGVWLLPVASTKMKNDYLLIITYKNVFIVR